MPAKISPDIVLKITRLLELLKRDVGADVATFFAYDADRDSYHCPIALGLKDLESFQDPDMRPRSDRGATQLLLEQGVLFVPDIHRQPSFHGAFTHRERIRAMAGAVGRHNGRPVALIWLCYKRPHKFHKDEQDAIWKEATALAELVSDSGVFMEAAPVPAQPVPQADDADAQRNLRDHALTVAIQLACAITNTPIAIWLKERGDDHYRIHAATGVSVSYRYHARHTPGNGGYLDQLLVTGKKQQAQCQVMDGGFRFPQDAEYNDWHSALAFPVVTRGKIVAIIEAFLFEAAAPGSRALSAFERLAELVRVAVENKLRSEETACLAQLSRALTKVPGFEHAISEIVEAARYLTQADSSVVFLYDQTSERFTTGARAPANNLPFDPPRMGDISHEILSSGVPLLIPDADLELRAVKARGRERARSLAAVPLVLGNEALGVLYVRAQRPQQFTSTDLDLLKALAAQTSVALGWARALLKPVNQLQQATAKAFQRDRMLDKLCDDILETLNFDYAAVQLIREDHATIETVWQKGELPNIANVAKHPLSDRPGLRDIQADVALADPLRLEIISGWNPRFDRWIFEEYHHEDLVRVWVPIVLLQDEDGNALSDWYESWHQINQYTEEETDPADDSRRGLRTSIEMADPVRCAPTGRKSIVIGTVDAGFRSKGCDLLTLHRRLSTDLALRLTKLVARHALRLRETLLTFQLQTIAACAKDIVAADAASLHFQYDNEHNIFAYNVSAGRYSTQFITAHPPRRGGLGHAALDSGTVVYVPDFSRGDDDNQLQDFNPHLWNMGVRAMAALPFLVGDHKGVLYVHYYRPHRFTSDELGWVKLFADRAVDAVRYSLAYTSINDGKRALTALHSVAQSMTTAPDSKNLLRKIAGSAESVLGADVATIYEYLQPEDHFVLPPEIAGRLLFPHDRERDLDPYAVPNLLVCDDDSLDPGEALYIAQDSQNDPKMNHPQPGSTPGGPPPFVVRECIRTSAAIKLRVGTEPVGVMFVHYRRRHNFSEQDIEVLTTLASNAAIAIRIRRHFATLSSGSRQILTALDHGVLTRLIVKEAVNALGGSSGDIRLVRRTGMEELVIEATFPESSQIDLGRQRIKLSDEIAHWVAREEGVLIHDCRRDDTPTWVPQHVVSMIATPIRSGDGQLFGIVSVYARDPAKFDEHSQTMLRTLAGHAAIALENERSRQRLADAEAMARIGDGAGNLIHRINNDVGAIRQLAMRLTDYPTDRCSEDGRRILTLAENTLAKMSADSSYKCTTEGKEGTVKNQVGLRLLKPKPTGASRCPTIILPNPIVA